MKNNEWGTVTGGERGYRFQDAVFGTRGLRGVTSQEMITGLCWGEAGDGRENTKGVASKHDDITWLAIDDAGDLGIWNVLNGVCTASVFGDADIVIVGGAVRGIVDHVLENRAISDGVIDIRFLLGREVDTLGVAAPLDVENTCVRPNVLVIADEEAVGVGRKGCLPGARKTEEKSDVIVILANIGRGMEGELTKFDGL